MTGWTLGIIGGSGLYALDGLEDRATLRIEGPFGTPSDDLVTGRIGTTRLVFLRHARLEVEAVCKTAAAPATDFPEGDMCVLTGATAFYVESARVTETKGATKVSVTLVNIGIT